MLILLLTSMLSSAFIIQPVKVAGGTIYIRADGSIDPPTANITSVDNVTYTFTDNNYDSICVERDNIIIDGANYTLQGTGSGPGMDLSSRSNVTIRNTKITSMQIGIWLSGSSNIISGNTLTNCGFMGVYVGGTNHTVIANKIAMDWGFGISLYESSNDIVFGNVITSPGGTGILFYCVSNESVFENYIEDSHRGFDLLGNTAFNPTSFSAVFENTVRNCTNAIDIEAFTHYYKVYHNSFVETGPAIFEDYWSLHGANSFDQGYPSGGNYWSDYHGPDWFSGPYQNETGSDGIGDVPYIIGSGNIDHYPLKTPYPCLNDVAIRNVNPNQTAVMEGHSVQVDVEVVNQGHFTETFNVTLYANTTIVDSLTNITLTKWDSTTLKFAWNTTGFAEGNYVLKAYADPVPGEVWPNDNELSYEFVSIIHVAIQELTPCNQVGDPRDSFQLGGLAYFKVKVDVIGQTLPQLLTINVYDSENTTIGVESFQGPVNPGVSTFVISVYIPPSSHLGNAKVYANLYTDWPHNGGVPYCPEASSTFQITGP